MREEPLAWYPWYWRDWQADYAVIRLTYAERGLYRELLDASWKQGGLPDNPTDLAELSRGPIEEFVALWPSVKRFWKAGPDGLLRNDKLELVREKQSERRQQLIEAGRKGGSSTSQAYAKHKLSKAQALKQSRVETTLTTAKGGRRFQAAPPSPVALTLASTLPDLVGDAPTPEQRAELAAVTSALKGNR